MNKPIPKEQRKIKVILLLEVLQMKLLSEAAAIHNKNLESWCIETLVERAHVQKNQARQKKGN